MVQILAKLAALNVPHAQTVPLVVLVNLTELIQIVNVKHIFMNHKLITQLVQVNNFNKIIYF